MNPVFSFGLGMTIASIFLGFFSTVFPKPNKSEKEIVVKEYLQHPKRFKVYQIKDDTIVVDIKVEYLK